MAATSAHGVSETARERETLRYNASLITGAIRLSPDLTTPSSLKLCADTALTAFAALAACRLGVSRALIPLFDSQYEYVVAEATASSTLSASLPADSCTELLLYGTALPRSASISEPVLLAAPVASSSSDGLPQLPVHVVPDIANDAELAASEFFSRFSQHRCFAGAPIRTERNIAIGVLSVRHHHVAPDGKKKHIFSKAANILRESTEVEGVLFLDASISSFGGRAANHDTAATAGTEKSSSPSADDDRDNGRSSSDVPREPSGPRSRVLGFSTSTSSSIDNETRSIKHGGFPDKLLRKLLKQHPQGVIFNFDENGALQSSDFSSDISSDTADAPGSHDAAAPGSRQDGKGSRRRMSTKRTIVKAIIDMFPGARNVASFPAWDGQKHRWVAGGFAYTNALTRVFTVEGELSYLMAFGVVSVAQVLRAEAMLAETSKTEVLNSLSHEFRSPLHGMVLGVELFRDSNLDFFQESVLRTAEACSRTLLDTVDHLMDWTGINNFKRESSNVSMEAQNGGDRGLRKGDAMTVEAGMMNIASDVNLDILTEEVVETVFAGHSLQMLSANQQWTGSSPEGPITESARHWDSVRAIESLTPRAAADGSHPFLLGGVSVSVDFAPDISWAFHIQHGAVRRIVMNLVGNSLKYTTDGFVKVSLAQEVATTGAARSTSRNIRIVVVDSGCGISPDYLANDIFTPFTQENSLSSGSGLGLSIARKIVHALGGSIRIRSKVGKGTMVVVRFTADSAPSETASAAPPVSTAKGSLKAEAEGLKGLRIGLIGYKPGSDVISVLGTVFDESALVANICQSMLKMKMVEPEGEDTVRPDILCDERHIERLVTSSPRPPAVVLCRSTLSARQLASRFKSLPGSADDLVEFVSQPICPHKLATILSLTMKRWATEQASSPRSLPKSAMSTQKSDMGPSDPSSAGPQVESEALEAQKISLPSRVLSTPNPDTSERTDPFESLETPSKQVSFLLVDDNAINLRMISAFMTKLGQLTNSLDISMPVMDGFQATRKIRQIETERALTPCAVMALTGLATEGSQQEAFASGIDLFLTKPVKLEEIRQILAVRGLT
ncbi:putative histidine kinase/response regulator [Xylaria digitata]|nr:putative histidine kinase/response regulator [Xylaria digitata]